MGSNAVDSVGFVAPVIRFSAGVSGKNTSPEAGISQFLRNLTAPVEYWADKGRPVAVITMGANGRQVNVYLDELDSAIEALEAISADTSLIGASLGEGDTRSAAEIYLDSLRMDEDGLVSFRLAFGQGQGSASEYDAETEAEWRKYIGGMAFAAVTGQIPGLPAERARASLERCPNLSRMFARHLAPAETVETVSAETVETVSADVSAAETVETVETPAPDDARPRGKRGNGGPKAAK